VLKLLKPNKPLLKIPASAMIISLDRTYSSYLL